MIKELQKKGSYAVHAKWGIDVLEGKLVKGAMVLVEGDRIMGFGSEITIPGAVKMIDLGDATIMPGLHDNHCHLMLEPRDLDTVTYKRSSARKTLDALVNAQKTLMAGFTTVRDPGDCDWQYGLCDLRPSQVATAMPTTLPAISAWWESGRSSTAPTRCERRSVKR
jgi:imidazolonepropionase-like amidohydrolase